MRRALLYPILCATCLGLGGCAVVTVVGAVAGAAIDVTAAVVTTGVKVTGKAISAAIPDDDDKPVQPPAAEASGPSPD